MATNFNVVCIYTVLHQVQIWLKVIFKSEKQILKKFKIFRSPNWQN